MSFSAKSVPIFVDCDYAYHLDYSIGGIVVETVGNGTEADCELTCDNRSGIPVLIPPKSMCDDSIGITFGQWERLGGNGRFGFPPSSTNAH